MTSFSFKPLSLCSFGFDTFHSNSSPSHSGNLWCFSESSLPFSMSLSDFSSQHLSMLQLNSATGLLILIIGIYGSTNQSQMKALWKTLIDHSSKNFPWCVLGDLNVILSHDEKLSLRSTTPSSLKDFHSTVMRAYLFDLHFIGNKYS